MEENKPVKTGAGESLSEEQVTSIAGGDGTTASGGSSGVNVTTTAPDPGTALISIYEGFVDVTSHIIERVVGAVKN
ncbi:MAG TPA: hypothetical protein VGI57_00175 [Usitatibacter sp.]|jgi:hypothetical protein